MPYRYKKKRYKIKPLPVIIAILILILIGFLLIKFFKSFDKKDLKNINSSQTVSKTNSDDKNNENSIAQESTASQANSKTTGLPVGSKSDWNLILLNPEEQNKIDQDLNIEKTKFDTQWVDSRAAQAYQEMCEAAQKENITLYLRSGFRSMATQKRNFDNEVQRYKNLGKSDEEALTLTKQYYTVPGHSEHHTGLAFDIITPQYHNEVYTLDERFAQTDAYKWLKENCSKYGFILRYTKEKKDITEINFEPWHYRYVGVEHAKYMTENNLCLEEYLKLFDK